jgi:ElaB/YqjD/DUF883 family membrane-anchored ribosome-binding protein
MESTPFPKSQNSSQFSGASPNGSSDTNGQSQHMGMDSPGSQADIGTSSNYSTTGDTPRQTSASFVSKVHDAVDRMAELAGRYGEKQSQAMEASKTMVKDKPMMAVGAALAFGLLIGRLTSR